jgi:hypothetical protein
VAWTSPKTWNFGDVLTAADMNTYVRDNTGFLEELVTDVLLTGTTGSVALSVGTGNCLEVFTYTRTTEAVAASSLQLFINGGGVNQDIQRLNGSAASATATETLNTANATWTTPGASAAANKFGCAYIRIPHYLGTTNHKTIVISASHVDGTASGSLRTMEHAFVWRSTAAITDVDFAAGSGSLDTGCRFSSFARN